MACPFEFQLNTFCIEINEKENAQWAAPIDAFLHVGLRRTSQKATGFHSLTLLIARHYNLLLSQSKLFTPLSSVVGGVVGVECGLYHHYHLPARFCAPSDKAAPIRDSGVPPFLHRYQIDEMEKSWGTAYLHKRAIGVGSVCPAQGCRPSFFLRRSGTKR